MQWLALESHLDQSSASISERFELIFGCRLQELVVSNRLLPLTHYGDR